MKSDQAVILVRLLVGGVFLSEGIQKFLFPDALGVGRFIKIGIPAPQLMAPFVGIVEIGCGALLILGLLTRLACIPLLIDISVAIATTKIPLLLKEGFWKAAHEARVDADMFLGLLFLLIVGGGAWSLDAWRQRKRAGARTSGILMALIAVTLSAMQARADEAPQKWEQLFYPFPIVGAPPQLEQQVQLFGSYFTGTQGQGVQPSAELAYIATAHLGLVATVPYQIGYSGQPTGWQDSSLLVQYLAAGSLEKDYMLSLGAQANFPTGASALTANDYLVGPFAYAAKRYFNHLIFEANATVLVPTQHAQTAGQVLLNGLISYMTTPAHAKYPVYVQAEIDSTRFVNGTLALPEGDASSPAQTVNIAPELFFGPFKTPLNDGTRIAIGEFFNLSGDPTHHRVYSLTIAFDIPNRFGY